MALKYKITKDEFSALDEEKQSHYQPAGENHYRLVVEGINESDDVIGMKSKIDELLDDKRKREEALRIAEEEARRKEEERALAEGNYKQLFESSQAKTAEWEQRYSSLEQSIHQRDISLAATRVATNIADGPNAEILAEFISRRLKVVDGQVRVTDEAGNLSVASLADLEKEYQSSPRYASLVRGSQAGGGGAAPKSGGVATKSWEEMTGMERVELRRTNPAEHKRLKEAHEQANQRK